MQIEISSMEKETAKEDFWNNRQEAEKLLLELKNKSGRLNSWKELREKINELSEYYNLAIEENDHGTERDILNTLAELEKQYSDLRIMELLGDEYDSSSSFLTIHSGAGGTEACDWVSMLLRMYTRWAEHKNYKVSTIDYLETEGGLKSVTVLIKGEYAYGYLKSEAGIHRLVRISPFDSSKRRHTSFASVYPTPEIDDNIEVEINAEDLRIDTYRAAGAGGQHVNKTDSAVRITHIPTNIVVQCQNERSQFKNKSMAMKVLRSRLYEHYRKEREEEKRKTEQEKKDIAWGNQIRSYVFHPYSMVKDHRTKYETGNIQAVMDGSINDFLEEYLKLTWKK
jgi:peptide chain release factor 2